MHDYQYMTDAQLATAYVSLTEKIATGLRVAEKCVTGFARRATLHEVYALENELLDVIRVIESRQENE